MFPFLGLVTTVISKIVAFLIPRTDAVELLFNGRIRDEHKTKYALKEISDRYKESIKGFNRAVAFNVGFALIALYSYLVLPVNEKVTIPFVALPVTRQVWISIVPLISYVLQTYAITSFIWFFILRQSIKILNMEVGIIDDFGDATNIILDGSLGHLWLILRISQYFKSRWNLIWYLPTMSLFLITIASPILLCIYFIVQLFYSGSFFLGFIYSIFIIIYALLFIILVTTLFNVTIADALINKLEEKTLEKIQEINNIPQ